MLKLIAASAAVLSLCACATITRGTTQAFEVKTVPSGAKVVTTMGVSCEATPCVFPNVPRNSNFMVTITKPGYKTVTTNITNANLGEGNMNLAGNILAGGLIGIGLDASNGSLQDLVPNPLEVTLEPESGSASAAPAGAPPGWQPAPTTDSGS